MIVNDLVVRVKNRSHRGDITVTNDAITQRILDAINDARREVIRLLPKQWLRATANFNTVAATVAGGATYGTLTSASSPSTGTLAAIAKMAISLNGETAQTITLSSTANTGALLALSIQSAVNALTAVNSFNQNAYTLFTCTFTGGLYVLTSGMTGTNSTVAVTAITGVGITDAATALKLTVATSAVAVTGTGAASFEARPVPLYDLPADCQEPVLFRYNYKGADYFLSKVDSEREFYLNVFGTTVAPNKPLFFFDAGVNQSTSRRQVYIWPIADVVYTIFLTYMMDPTLVDLAVTDLNSQIPVFPSYIQDCLWKGAYYHFLKEFDDPKTAEAKLDYQEAKEAVVEADEEDLDTDLAFRMDIGRKITDFRSPGTGIRLK